MNRIGGTTRMTNGGTRAVYSKSFLDAFPIWGSSSKFLSPLGHVTLLLLRK